MKYKSQLLGIFHIKAQSLSGMTKISVVSVLCALLLISCSSIQFYDKQHGPDNFTKEDVVGQIASIKKSDPILDSTVAHYLFDNRYVSVVGVGQTFFGLDTSDLSVLSAGSKAIWGTTDLAPNDTLLAWAVDYSYKYNSNLLELRGLGNLKKPLDARERQFVEHFKK